MANPAAEMARVKSELEQFNSSCLKHTQTQEKNTLPTKEDVKQEKTDKYNLVQGVESFKKDQLNRTLTQEKFVLPNAEDVATEKVQTAQTAVIHDLVSFAKDNLNKTETIEKVVLPDKDVIEQEKQFLRQQEGNESSGHQEAGKTSSPTKAGVPNA